MLLVAQAKPSIKTCRPKVPWQLKAIVVVWVAWQVGLVALLLAGAANGGG